MGDSVPSKYFVDLYEREADPWQFATSAYEAAKYRATIDALPRDRYGSGCELACSIGVFTQMLAQRCERLHAVDVSPAALASARERCRGQSNVTFAKVDLLRDYPSGGYDLTTICEFGFYFAYEDLARLRDRVAQHTVSGGDVVLVHWTPRTPGHALPAHNVHALFCDDPRFQRVHGFEAETYMLDVVRRR
jgi:SAM-dependent methyltransferase